MKDAPDAPDAPDDEEESLVLLNDDGEAAEPAAKPKRYRCSLCKFSDVAPWRAECPQCFYLADIIKPKRDPEDRKRATLGQLAQKDPVRYKSGIDELDKVLGGGIVKGSVVTITGPPGTGKTTLLEQVCNSLAPPKGKRKALYTSGEQSNQDLGYFAKRLGIENDNIIALGNTDEVSEIIAEAEVIKPIILVIDSVQKAHLDDVDSELGSTRQVEAISKMLTGFAKRTGVVVFLVSQVNKEGDLAGPQSFAHEVDAVVYFEPHPAAEIEKSLADVRVLRTIMKNRFGKTGIETCLEMTEKGLQPLSKFTMKRLAKIESDLEIED